MVVNEFQTFFDDIKVEFTIDFGSLYIEYSIKSIIIIALFIIPKFVIKSSWFVAIALPLTAILALFGNNLNGNSHIILAFIGLVWYIYVIISANKCWGWKKALALGLSSLLIIPFPVWCVLLAIEYYRCNNYVQVNTVKISSGNGNFNEEGYEEFYSDFDKIFSKSLKKIWIVSFFVIFSLIVFVSQGSEQYIAIFGTTFMLLWIIAFIFYVNYHNQKHTVYLNYDIDPSREKMVDAFYKGFETLDESDTMWHIFSEKNTKGGYKYNAGATKSISREKIEVEYNSFNRVKVNMFVPVLSDGNIFLHFLPDFILVVSNRNHKSVILNYDKIEFKLTIVNYRETESRPSDSEMVGVTWEHPNADGSPDGRFNENKKIPIMEYLQIDIICNNTSIFKFMVSNVKKGKEFVQCFSAYKSHLPSFSYNYSIDDYTSLADSNDGFNTGIGSNAQSEKDWSIVLLLTLFLGAIGVHRFYTKRIRSGIIMLLTAGGCGIWWIIDIYLVASKKYRDKENCIVK